MLKIVKSLKYFINLLPSKISWMNLIIRLAIIATETHEYFGLNPSLVK